MHTHFSTHLRPFFQAAYVLGVLLLMTLAAPLLADPVVSGTIGPATLPLTGGGITISAKVTDSAGKAITSVTGYMYLNGNYIGNVSLANGGAGSSYTGIFPSRGNNTSSASETYTAAVTATNALNVSVTATATGQVVQAYDNTPPTITTTKLDPATLPVTGGSITLTATVIDPNGRALTNVQGFLYQNGNYLNNYITLSNGGSGNVYTGVFGGIGSNTTSADYSYTATIVATNDLNLTNSASAAGNTVLPHDNQPPTLTKLTLSPANLPVTGGLITLTATVIDPNGRALTNVQGFLYQNGNYLNNYITLSNGGSGNIYTGNFGVGSNTSNAAYIYTATASATNDLGLSNTAVTNGQTGQENNGPPGSLVPLLLTSDPAKPILSPDSLPVGSPDTSLTITGMNFASDAEVSINGVLLASSLITSASSTQIIITVPAPLLTQPGALAVCVISPSLGSLSNGVNLQVEGGNGTTYTPLTGTDYGTAGSYNNDGLTFQNAFDGNLNTYFDAPAPGNGDTVGIDLGASNQKAVTRIDFCPRSGYGSRMVGGVFQGSNGHGVFTTLYTVTSAPATGVLTRVTLNNTTAYRYVQYVAPNGSYGNVAEVEFDMSP